MSSYYFAWWNVENLFDVENSALRPEWLAANLKSELKGWTSSVLSKKIANLASIIKQMNNGTGPDVLGVCEIENENVVKLLVQALNIAGRTYKVVHHDTKDGRGIDIAFIYDSKKFSKTGKLYHYEVLKRTATRDIIQIELKTKKGNSIILIGNHWPARSAGQFESEPYRIIAAETLSYWMQRIHEIRGDDIPVLVAGDFNDEPFNRSMADYALSCSSKNKVLNGKNPYLFNLMWEELGKRNATFIFDRPNLLDQFLVNKGMLKSSSPFKVNAASIVKFPELVKGDYDTPIKFSRPSEAGFNDKGYSDHLPVAVMVEES